MTIRITNNPPLNVRVVTGERVGVFSENNASLEPCGVCNPKIYAAFSTLEETLSSQRAG